MEARGRLWKVINRAAFGKERVVLARRGKPLVALAPTEDVEALEDQRDAQEVRERRAEWKREVTTQDAGGGQSPRYRTIHKLNPGNAHTTTRQASMIATKGITARQMKPKGSLKATIATMRFKATGGAT